MGHLYPFCRMSSQGTSQVVNGTTDPLLGMRAINKHFQVLWEFRILGMNGGDIVPLPRQLIPIMDDYTVFSLTRVDGFPLSRE